ncbi:hypothetical protein [Bradyrhizobium ivorense]|uniref:hypothetical protein n=1 Tax=Bradyrhizobium ivorense TaxID=2511166 RepID=UPI00155A9F7F|nr:hypothetical protein [Bradyrhizobium ivorense]
MTIELVLLVASVVLGIVHIIIVSHLQSGQHGLSMDSQLKGTQRCAAHVRRQERS